jgi:hypothetical protein
MFPNVVILVFTALPIKAVWQFGKVPVSSSGPKQIQK